MGSRHKTQYADTQLQLESENEIVKKVKNTKVLGVQLDENLNWEKHIDYISSKVSSGIGAIKRCDIFKNVDEIHNYNLRGSATNFYIPKPKTEFLKNSFGYCGAKLWNQIPEQIRNWGRSNHFVISFLPRPRSLFQLNIDDFVLELVYIICTICNKLVCKYLINQFL